MSGGLVADAGLVPGSERMADFTARLAERIDAFSAEAKRPPSDADMLSMARDLTMPGRLRGSDGGKGEEASSLDLGKISTALNAPGAGLTRGFTKAILSAGDLLGVIPSETATKLSAFLDEEAAAATKGNPVAGVLDEGGAISGQYLLPFLRVTRALELLGAGKIVAGMMGGLATDFVFTGQNDASIGEVARDIGPLDQPALEMVRSAVAEGLAKNESDGAFEKRLKNVGAGLLAPAAITVIGGLYRAARAGTPLARQSFQSFARAVDEAHARVTKNAANGIVMMRSGGPDTDETLASLRPMVDAIRAATPEDRAFPVRQKLRELYDQALANRGGKFEPVSLGTVGEAEAAKIQAETGIDVSGYERKVDSYGIIHVDKKHGDTKKEALRGQLPITREDIANIPLITSAPDKIEYAGKTSIGWDIIVYRKTLSDQEESLVFYAEEVRGGRKNIVLQSMWKRRADEHHAAANAAPSLVTSETLRSTAPMENIAPTDAISNPSQGHARVPGHRDP